MPGCGWMCVFPSPFWYLSASVSVDITSSVRPSVLVFCVSIFYYYYYFHVIWLGFEPLPLAAAV